MKCRQCDGEMTYFEGEDEGSGDMLIPYQYWWCPICDLTIHDYDDEFEEPTPEEQHERHP